MLMFLGIGLIGSSVGAGVMYTYLIKNNKVVSKAKYMECLREFNNLIEEYRELQEGK